MKIKYLLISLVFCSLGFSQQILFLTPNQGMQGTSDLEVTLIASGVNFYDEYKLTLPSKSTFSLAYIFGSKGLISLDYEIFSLLLQPVQ